jgi:hypothetical protein
MLGVRRGARTFSVSERQRGWVRIICIATVLIQIPLGVGLYRQAAWATGLWPLPDVRMTYILLSAIVATTATLLAWAAWRDEPGAVRAIGFELMVATPAIGLYLLWLALDRREGDLTASGVAFIAFGLACAVLGRSVRQVPLADPRPLPDLFRWSFVGFCCVLIPVGVALVLQVEDILPWAVSSENSTVIGLIFLSAAALFIWIIRHPRWAYGEMALTSFFAYDLVLVVPYVDLLRNRNDTATVSSYYGGDPSYAVVAGDNGINERSLAVYLTVLAVSAVLAVGIHVWGLRPRAVDVAAPAD